MNSIYIRSEHILDLWSWAYTRTSRRSVTSISSCSISDSYIRTPCGASRVRKITRCSIPAQAREFILVELSAHGEIWWDPYLIFSYESRIGCVSASRLCSSARVSIRAWLLSISISVAISEYTYPRANLASQLGLTPMGSIGGASLKNAWSLVFEGFGILVYQILLYDDTRWPVHFPLRTFSRSDELLYLV